MKRWLTRILVALLLVPLLLLRPDIPHNTLLGAYANDASRFITIDGMSIHYRDEGAGPILVLVHGTNASLHTWDGWVTALSPHYRLIRMDLPGHGLSDSSPKGDYRVTTYVDVLDHFAQAIGLNQFALAGSSMGGDIAWHYALAHPAKVQQLILLDATGFPAPRPPIFQMIGLPVVGQLAALMTPRFLTDMVVRDLYGDDARITPATYERYATLSRHAGNRQAMYQLLRAWSTDDFARIAEVRQPTLVMWGAADTFQDVAFANRFGADIADSTLIIYPGVGHLPMEEIPAQTAADVRVFLARNT